MKTSRSTKTIIIISAVLLFGATIAFAHGGWGHGENRHMRGNGGHMMRPGYGGHMMDYHDYGPHMRGYGTRAELTDEQRAKLGEARDKFYKETQEVRGQIEEKSVALRNEMAKEEPDTERAVKLQKEISQLRANFDQKAVLHKLEIRKLVPDGSYGKGHGRRHGRGTGGYCW